jgi:hypothetical protein
MLATPDQVESGPLRVIVSNETESKDSRLMNKAIPGRYETNDYYDRDNRNLASPQVSHATERDVMARGVC